MTRDLLTTPTHGEFSQRAEEAQPSLLSSWSAVPGSALPGAEPRAHLLTLGLGQMGIHSMTSCCPQKALAHPSPHPTRSFDP